MKRTVFLAVALLVSLVLTGCAPVGPSAAKPGSTPSATAPTPETSAPAVHNDTRPTRILITSERIEILSDAGFLAESFTYFQPIETVDGIRVGDPAAPLESAHHDTANRWQFQGRERLDLPVGVVAIPSDDGRTFAVEVWAVPADGAVTGFLAPRKNFE